MAHSPRPRPDSSAKPSAPESAQPEDALSFPDLIKALSASGHGTLSADLALDLVLHDIVERIRSATHANAAAIALQRDGEFVCRATVGENAPGLGIVINKQSGFSALCLTARQWQLCDDTQQDSRVDAAASARLGVRSILTYPIVQEDLLGVIEVFSPSPKAFSEQDAEILEVFSREIVESIEKASNVPVADSAMETTATAASEIQGCGALVPNVLPTENTEASSRDVLTTLLTYAVVMLAIILIGLVGRLVWKSATAKPTVRPQSVSARATNASVSQTESTPPSAPADIQTIQPAVSIPAPATNDVVVYRNGKIVYPRQSARKAAAVEQPSATEPPRLSPDIAAEYVAMRVEPDYPEAARAQRIQGSVVLDTLVSKEGTVKSVTPISGNSLLATAATEAIRQWQFRPFFRNGEPTEFSTCITIVFRLPEKN